MELVGARGSCPICPMVNPALRAVLKYGSQKIDQSGGNCIPLDHGKVISAPIWVFHGCNQTPDRKDYQASAAAELAGIGL